LSGHKDRKGPALEPVGNIRDLIAAEIAEGVAGPLVAEFRAALVEPEPIEVTFSGGLTQRCWTVTRSDGDYRVVYMPRAGYFALCVESVFGPLDIGVHGRAIGCYGSV
jgi:hypothetical protein